MLYGIFLILIGALAAMSLVTKLVKDSEKLLNTIVPYQGYIGIAAFIWGIWGVIYTILNLGWLGTWPIWWVTQLATSVIELLIGFILGYGLLSKYVLSKNEEAKKKGDELLAKLANFQILLGLIAIGIGVWYTLYILIIIKIIKM